MPVQNDHAPGKTSSGLRFALGLGKALCVLLDDPTIHDIFDCGALDKGDFVSAWRTWIAATDLGEAGLQDLYQPFGGHSALLLAPRVSGGSPADQEIEPRREFTFCSDAAWDAPCSADGCIYSVDLPFPPSPSELRQQMRRSSDLLLAEHMQGEACMQWEALRLLQEMLFTAFCNVPHICALARNTSASQGLEILRSGTTWHGRAYAAHLSHQREGSEWCRAIGDKLREDDAGTCRRWLSSEQVRTLLLDSAGRVGPMGRELPLNMLYFLAAAEACPDHAAELHAVALHCDKGSRAQEPGQLLGIWLVPNLAPLAEVLGAAPGSPFRDLESYWGGCDKANDDDWRGLFALLAREFQVPEELATMAMVSQCSSECREPSCDCGPGTHGTPHCESPEEQWFTEHTRLGGQEHLYSDASQLLNWRRVEAEAEEVTSAEVDDRDVAKVTALFESLERSLKEKLGLDRRQLWLLRIRQDTGADAAADPVLDFVGLPGIGSLGKRAAVARENADAIWNRIREGRAEASSGSKGLQMRRCVHTLLAMLRSALSAYQEATQRDDIERANVTAAIMRDLSELIGFDETLLFSERPLGSPELIRVLEDAVAEGVVSRPQEAESSTVDQHPVTLLAILSSEHRFAQLTAHPHRVSGGVVGKVFDSRIAALGVSTFGDPRTLLHYVGKADSVPKAGFAAGIDAEVFFYVRIFRDFYAFPVFVCHRLWGMVTFQRDPYSGDGTSDRLGRSGRQFDSFLAGLVAARTLGRRLERFLIDLATSRMQQQLASRVAEDLDTELRGDRLATLLDFYPCFSAQTDSPPTSAWAAGRVARLRKLTEELLGKGSEEVSSIPTSLFVTFPVCKNRYLEEYGQLIVSTVTSWHQFLKARSTVKHQVASRQLHAERMLQKAWSHALKNSFMPIRDAAYELARSGQGIKHILHATRTLCAAQIAAFLEEEGLQWDTKEFSWQKIKTRNAVTRACETANRRGAFPLLRLPRVILRDFSSRALRLKDDQGDLYLAEPRQQAALAKLEEHSPGAVTLDGIMEAYTRLYVMCSLLEQQNAALLRLKDTTKDAALLADEGSRFTLGHGVRIGVVQAFLSYRAMLVQTVLDDKYERGLASLLKADEQAALSQADKSRAREELNRCFSPVLDAYHTEDLLSSITGEYDGGESFPLHLDVVDQSDGLSSKGVNTDAMTILSVVVFESIANMFKHGRRAPDTPRLLMRVALRVSYDEAGEPWLELEFANSAYGIPSDRRGVSLTIRRPSDEHSHRDLREALIRIGWAGLEGNLRYYFEIGGSRAEFRTRIDESLQIVYAIPVSSFLNGKHQVEGVGSGHFA